MTEDKDPPQKIDFDLLPIRGLSTHTFNGATYNIFRAIGRREGTGNAMGDGYCESRDVPDRLLWIQNELYGLQLITVLIHEALHASLENLPEEKVDQIGREIGDFVFRWLLATDENARRANGMKPLAETPEEEISPEGKESA